MASDSLSLPESGPGVAEVASAVRSRWRRAQDAEVKIGPPVPVALQRCGVVTDYPWHVCCVYRWTKGLL